MYELRSMPGKKRRGEGLGLSIPTFKQIFGCSLYHCIHRCIACDTTPLGSFPSAAQVLSNEQAEQLLHISQSRCS